MKLPRYAAFKRALICSLGKVVFELAVLQVVVGVGLWVVAYAIKSGEPPIVLAMSALALVFSGATSLTEIAVGERDR